MRVVVTGATGNVGTSVLDALAMDPNVREIVGVARRLPAVTFDKTQFVTADVGRADITDVLRGADAVVHLAWRIQPAREPGELERTNVEGSQRVFESAARAGVRALIYASSVGVYSPAPKERLRDESWSREGVATSLYSRQKASVERLLDRIEQDNPRMRVVRLRPSLCFKREAASGIRRLFIGPFLPRWVLHPKLIRFVPDNPNFRFQVVHTADVAEAYRLCVTQDVHGPFNIASDPVIDPETLARTFDAKLVRVTHRTLRTAAEISYRLHLGPADPGWVDLAFQAPLLDCSRARRELGWSPRRTAVQALLELLDGLRERASVATPPLSTYGSAEKNTRVRV